MKGREGAGYGFEVGGSRVEPDRSNERVYLCGIRNTVGKPCTRHVTHQGGGKPMCSFHYGKHVDALLRKK